VCRRKSVSCAQTSSSFLRTVSGSSPSFGAMIRAARAMPSRVARSSLCVNHVVPSPRSTLMVTRPARLLAVASSTRRYRVVEASLISPPVHSCSQDGVFVLALALQGRAGAMSQRHVRRPHDLDDGPTSALAGQHLDGGARRQRIVDALVLVRPALHLHS